MEIVVGKIMDHKSETYGLDAQNEKYVDMIEAGIVDPGQGRAHRFAGCRPCCRSSGHYRSHGRRTAEGAGTGHAQRRWRHGRRYGLLTFFSFRT